MATHALDGRGTTVFSSSPSATSSGRALALSGQKLDVAGIVDKVGPSVVSIRSTITTQGNPFFGGGGTEEAAGTGVIISADGEISGPEGRRTWHVEHAAYSMLVPAGSPTD